MENRRKTRSRPQRYNAEAPAPPTNPQTRKRSSIAPAAAVVSRGSPVRRSSRPRSAVFGTSATTTTNSVVDAPSTINEVDEPKQSTKSRNNLPNTLTTNTSSRAPNKSQTTESVHSSYTSTTAKTVEIRPNSSETVQLDDFIRRSESRTNRSSVVGESTHTPTTELESRYSRSLSRSQYDDDNYSKAEFSDNENNIGNIDDFDEFDEHYKSFDTSEPTKLIYSGERRKLKTPREFGGWIGAMALMLLAPCLIYYLQWSCATGKCVLKSLDLSAVPATLADFYYLNAKLFPLKPVMAFWSFNWIVLVLTALGLFPRRVRLGDQFSYGGIIEYNFNVFPTAVLMTIGIAVAEYVKYPVANFVLRNYLRFCSYGLLSAFIVALWCYFNTNLVQKTKLSAVSNMQANEYGQSGNFIIDYALGRQINPKSFGFINLKQVYYRISLLATLLFAECFVYKNIQLPLLPADKEGILNILEFYWSNTKYDTVALLCATLLIIYIADAIIFEHHLASSFELQNEGFGCLLLLRYAATPFILSAVAKYFLDNRTPLKCVYAIYVPIVVLLLGLMLKRLSCAIKYKYRLDPYNAIFKNIETIPTHQGRRLLLGQLWGRLRQPNYTGDIIALLALGIPMYLRFAWPPVIGLFLCVLLLLHRAIRVNARNILRYQSAWVRYCVRAQNYVVPKIF